jgi:hypothetical protein
LTQDCFHLSHLLWLKRAKPPDKFDRWHSRGLLHIESAIAQPGMIHRHFKPSSQQRSGVGNNNTQSSPRWMRGRGMTIVLVPDIGGEFGERFPRDVSVIPFQANQPNDEIVPLSIGQRHDIIFQFSQTHR